MNLSLTEIEVLQDTEFLTTKTQAIDKIITLFGEVELSLREYIRTSTFLFPPDVAGPTGKISRGEKYRGLPYLVLDFPRKFKHNSTFAYRTIFLWADSFSCTLFLSGEDLGEFRQALASQRTHLKGQGFWICTNTDPWEHHFEAGNYLPLDQVDGNELDRIFSDHPFLKLARRIEIKQWRELDSFSISTLDILLKCMEQ